MIIIVYEEIFCNSLDSFSFYVTIDSMLQQQTVKGVEGVGTLYPLYYNFPYREWKPLAESFQGSDYNRISHRSCISESRGLPLRNNVSWTLHHV